MAGEESAAGSARGGGLMSSLKGLVATLIAVLHTRLHLIANDLEAEGLRLRRMAVLLVLAGIFFSLAMFLLTLCIIVAFWDINRLLVAGCLAALYFVVSVGFLVFAKRCAAAAPRPFAATLGELRKDREGLTQ
jgi:uncharacterized membrane protein YqjE